MKKVKNLKTKVLFVLILVVLALFCFAPGLVLTTCPDASLFWRIVMTIWTVPAALMCLYYYWLMAKTPAKKIEPPSLDLSFLDEGYQKPANHGTFETKAAVMILLTIALGAVVGFDISSVFSSWKLPNSTLYALILTAVFFLCAWVFPEPKKDKRKAAK